MTSKHNHSGSQDEELGPCPSVCDHSSLIIEAQQEIIKKKSVEAGTASTLILALYLAIFMDPEKHVVDILHRL